MRSRPSSQSGATTTAPAPSVGPRDGGVNLRGSVTLTPNRKGGLNKRTIAHLDAQNTQLSLKKKTGAGTMGKLK